MPFTDGFPFRHQIDHLKYNVLNNKDLTLLTSILVLFFRELPEPLIDDKLRDYLKESMEQKTLEEVIKMTRYGFTHKNLTFYDYMQGLKNYRKVLDTKMPQVWYFTLKYLMKHLKEVGENSNNRMNPKSLALVMSPALVIWILEYLFQIDVPHLKS